MKKKKEEEKKKKEQEEENKMKEKRKNFEMLIMKMIELRDIRREKQNITNLPYQDTNEFFLLKHNYYSYLKEKEMKEEKERIAKLERKQQQQQNPMNRFRKQLDKITTEDPISYYYQAERDINDLIKIRREWDEYIVPEGSIGSSKIPWTFIEPPNPANYIWESYLLADPKDVGSEVNSNGNNNSMEIEINEDNT